MDTFLKNTFDILEHIFTFKTDAIYILKFLAPNNPFPNK
jgi:hypothetical protein